jgi:hypothetical protein
MNECIVCGSHSLLNIARMLGGSQISQTANRSKKDRNFTLYDLEIAIGLQQMESRDLNDTIEGITALIGPSLVQGQARLHIKVEPVVERLPFAKVKAA